MPGTQLASQLHSITTIGHYQILLLDNRGVCVHTEVCVCANNLQELLHESANAVSQTHEFSIACLLSPPIYHHAT